MVLFAIEFEKKHLPVLFFHAALYLTTFPKNGNATNAGKHVLRKIPDREEKASPKRQQNPSGKYLPICFVPVTDNPDPDDGKFVPVAAHRKYLEFSPLPPIHPTV